MYSTPPVDIDFICWGPFTDPFSPCVEGLTAGSAIDCSYSPNPTEFCIIPESQAGDYYILLITNYSKENTDITFLQSSGSGTLDCDIGTGISPGFNPVSDDAVLKVYPNPVKDHLFIDYSEIREEPVGVEIINSLGLSVALTHYSSDMPGVLSLKITGLPAGFYMLRISFQKKVMNRMIIISE
jgi:hypothetical protein